MYRCIHIFHPFRLLSVIDEVATKSPLTRNRLIIEAPNIAVAAQGIRRQENRNIVMTTGDGSEENVEVSVLCAFVFFMRVFFFMVMCFFYCKINV